MTTTILGNTLYVQAVKWFASLSRFGNNLMAKFNGPFYNLPLLEPLMFINTPGACRGNRWIGRSHDFVDVIRRVAERADMIVLVFDAHKPDTSDEFKNAAEAAKKHSEKMLLVLNNMGIISSQQPMRVFGALMWTVGRSFGC